MLKNYPLYGEISRDAALNALFRGFEAKNELSLKNDEKIHHVWSGGIPDSVKKDGTRKEHIGRYWIPQIFSRGVCTDAVRKYGDLVKKYHKGLTADKLEYLVSHPFECDDRSIDDQLSLIEDFELKTGIRASLLVLSGDTRKESINAAGLSSDQIQGGKSVHGFISIRAIPADPENQKKWGEIQRMLISIFRSDPSIKDPPRLMRFPSILGKGSKTRIQTTIRAEEIYYDEQDLYDRLTAFCSENNITVEKEVVPVKNATTTIVARSAKNTLPADTNIQLVSGFSVNFGDYVGEKSRCYCPVHGDTSASAFVSITSGGCPYLFCSACACSYFPERKQKYNIAAKSEVVKSKKYLDYVDFESGITALKAPKGSGKTEIFAKNAQKWDNVFSVAHRRTLTRSISGRLGLPNYQDMSGMIEKSVSICLDSCHRLGVDPDSTKLTLIDEIRQLRHSLFFGNMNAYEALRAFNSLRALILESTAVGIADADLTQLDLDFIKMLRNDQNEEIKLISQEAESQTYYYTDSKNSIEKKIVELWKEGKKLAIAITSGGRDALKIKLLLEKTDNQARKVLLITAESIFDLKKSGLSIENINDWIRDYDAVIYSPVLGTGVSIDVDHFDAVVGLFHTSTITAQDCDQMLHRVRSAADRYVWIRPGGGHKELDAEKIAKNLIALARKSAQKCEDAEKAEFAILDPVSKKPQNLEFFAWYCKSLAERRQTGGDGCNLSEAFKHYCHENNIILESWGDLEIDKEIKTIVKECSNEAKTEIANKIYNAEIVPIEQVRAKIEPESSDDIRETKRAELVEFYGEIDENLVIQDNEGALRMKLRNFAAQKLISDGKIGILQNRDEKEIQLGSIGHLQHQALRAFVLSKILVDCGIDLFDFKNQGVINAEKCEKAARKYFPARSSLAEIGITINKNAIEAPIQWITKILQKMNISLVSKQKRVGGERVREYRVNKDSILECENLTTHYYAKVSKVANSDNNIDAVEKALDDLLNS